LNPTPQPVSIHPALSEFPINNPRAAAVKALSGPRLSVDERFVATEDEVSPKIRQMVQHARERQQERFQGTEIPFNAAIPGGHVRDFCHFTAAPTAKPLNSKAQGRNRSERTLGCRNPTRPPTPTGSHSLAVASVAAMDEEEIPRTGVEVHQSLAGHRRSRGKRPAPRF
jgi:Magnesium chelatase, subunit ChlI C-terminal